MQHQCIAYLSSLLQCRVEGVLAPDMQAIMLIDDLLDGLVMMRIPN